MLNWAREYCVNKKIFFDDLIRILTVWKNPSDKNKDDYAYLQKLFEKWGEGKFDSCFLSKVLKYPESILLYYIIDDNNNRFNSDPANKKLINITKDLYFKINPLRARAKYTDNNIVISNYDKIISIIEKYPSYILSRYLISDQLDCTYRNFINTFTVNLKVYKRNKKDKLSQMLKDERVEMLTDINNKIEKKQQKSKEDIKNDFLKLIEEAPKEAFKSQKDLLYYFLIKNFYYFSIFKKFDITNLIQNCNEIYKKKFPESKKDSNFFHKKIFISLLIDFRNFHNNNDYLKRLKILEEKEKIYFDSNHTKSVENESIKDNSNNNDPSMILSYSQHNYFCKRKSSDVEAPIKRQRLNDQVENDNYNNMLNQDESFILKKYYPANFLNQNVFFDTNSRQQVTYPAQQVTYSDQQGYYPPQQVTYYPDHQGTYYPAQQLTYYPPQQVTYSDQQGNYPAQQVTYSDQQGYYPPQQVTYFDQQGNYPAQQVTYSDQQGYYPPQQVTYSDQQGNYLTHQQQENYLDQQQGTYYPHQEQGYYPVNFFNQNVSSNADSSQQETHPPKNLTFFNLQNAISESHKILSFD